MILEIIITCIIGSLLHFTYEWSKHNKIVGIFSAVNESVWEHIKIGLSGLFLCTLIDMFIWESNPNYIIAKFICFISLIILIPVLFYSYKVFTKKAILIVDIIIFYIVIALSIILFNYILNINPLPSIYTYISIIGIILILIAYFTLTIKPLHNFLFKDPITNKYGLEGHPCHHKH